MNSLELRTCTEDEIYDYYDDPDSVDCEPPLDDSAKFIYVYNNENSCPAGTVCTNSGKCGMIGNLQLFLIQWNLDIVDLFVSGNHCD